MNYKEQFNSILCKLPGAVFNKNEINIKIAFCKIKSFLLGVEESKIEGEG